MNVILSIDSLRRPLTGIGQYTYQLASHLAELSDIKKLHFFLGPQFLNKLPEENSMPKARMSSPIGRVFMKYPWAVDMASSWFDIRKKQRLKSYSHCIFHGPSFYLPPFEGCSVCTIHDLSVYYWGHCHLPGRVRYLRKQIEKSLFRADYVIVDSDYTRREVEQYFGWPSDKISTVPLACSSNFKPRNSEVLESFLRKNDLAFGRYSLYVGTIEPRKNIDVLLDAYMRLPLDKRKQWPLLMVGYQGWKTQALHQRIQRAQSEGWVRYLGFVPQQDLPLFYAGARLFLFPSLYEGFGLPVLEAMASGVPVICSNAASLPEVVGDAAGLCDPNDVEWLTEKIAQGLEDETWRPMAVKKGLQRAAQFSWERCAEETLGVYRKASGSI